MSMSSKKKGKTTKTVAWNPQGLWGKVKDNNELDLSMMGYKEVPMVGIQPFGHRLTSLDLSNNQLKELGLDFASSLRQLTHLDLSKNLLISLPENLGLLVNLVHLDLYRNQLQRLPLSMGDMVKLRWVDIKDNPLVPTLEKVCGACSNQLECRTCAQNVTLFMKQLGEQIKSMGEREVEDWSDVVTTVPSRNVTKVVTRQPSKAPTATAREVFSPAQDHSGSDSETDKGSGEEEPIFDRLKSGIVGSSRKNRKSGTHRHRSMDSTMSVVDETGVIPTAQTGKHAKKKSSFSYKINKKLETVTWKEALKKNAKYYYEFNRWWLNIVCRIFLFIVCIYVCSFVLLAIVFDDSYMRYYMEYTPSLAGYILPMHDFFQRALQLGASSHYLPMVRMVTEVSPQNVFWEFYQVIVAYF